MSSAGDLVLSVFGYVTREEARAQAEESGESLEVYVSSRLDMAFAQGLKWDREDAARELTEFLILEEEQ